MIRPCRFDRRFAPLVHRPASSPSQTKAVGHVEHPSPARTFSTRIARGVGHGIRVRVDLLVVLLVRRVARESEVNATDHRRSAYAALIPSRRDARSTCALVKPEVSRSLLHLTATFLADDTLRRPVHETSRPRGRSELDHGGLARPTRDDLLASAPYFGWRCSDGWSGDAVRAHARRGACGPCWPRAPSHQPSATAT